MRKDTKNMGGHYLLQEPLRRLSNSNRESISIVPFFLKETLNRINPSYDARIVVLIIRPYVFNHYVCSFKTDSKLFIMDYGTPYLEITGVHGPYSSLGEYKKFYERDHPIKRKIEAITYLP